MGANIGTTVTAWLVSWLGFKADISVLAVPLMLLGFLFSNSKKTKDKILVSSLSVSAFSFSAFRLWKIRFRTWTIRLRYLSSSSLGRVMVLGQCLYSWHSARCWLWFYSLHRLPWLLRLACSAWTTQAKRAAMSHTIFNLFGVVWALILFNPFLSLVGRIIELFDLPNPAEGGYSITSPFLLREQPLCTGDLCCTRCSTS